MSFLDLYRDQVEWAASAGDSTYPGIPNLGEPTTIRVRDLGPQRVRIVDDVLDRRLYWVEPSDEVKPGDTLGGARVDQVREAKDAAGNVLYRIAYVEA